MNEAPSSTAINPHPEEAIAPDMDGYIERRLRPKQAWYDQAAIKAKRTHIRVIATQLTATALIPVANALGPAGINTGIATTCLAAIATIATGIAAWGKHHEHWMRYRFTADSLQSLLARYEYRLTPYDTAAGRAGLATDAEALLRGESENWQATVSSKAALKAAGKAAADDRKRERNDD